MCTLLSEALWLQRHHQPIHGPEGRPGSPLNFLLNLCHVASLKFTRLHSSLQITVEIFSWTSVHKWMLNWQMYWCFPVPTSYALAILHL